NTTAERPKYTYIRAITRFVEYLYASADGDRRQSFPAGFRELETVTATEFYLFGRSIYSRLNEQRGITGKSIFGNARSAIVYLFTATASLLCQVDAIRLDGC
ncbi:hypothetical protein GN958_ATG14258, partial [Phytophthora infestans]